MTLWLVWTIFSCDTGVMMMQHYNKLGNKRFISTEDTIQMNTYWNCEPLPNLDLESNPLFSEDNTAYQDVPLNQVWLQKDQQLKRNSHILLQKPSLWPSPRRKQANLFTCTTVPSLVTECLTVQKTSFGQTFSDILNLCCDLDQLNTAIQFFHRTLWLMTM